MQNILQVLKVTFDAAGNDCVLAGHIFEGLGRSAVPPTDEDARAALADLVQRELVEAVNSPVPSDVPQKGYKILPRGRDFVDHNYPWDLLDEYSNHNGQ